MASLPPCAVCGGVTFTHQDVLSDRLARQWRLSSVERAYTDRQQGTRCTECGGNLRTLVLAKAICGQLGLQPPLRDSLPGARVRILEINEAGWLSPALRQADGYVMASYPDVDMQAMPYEDSSFDLVVHSDTIEHVPHPLRALAECRRVLKPGGACCFTAPVIVGRLTQDRAGLEPSYHGDPDYDQDDLRVHTEFGADIWTYLIEAGFSRVSVDTLDYPAATAWTAMA